MIVLFVLEPEGGELCTFSQSVSDIGPKAVREVLESQGFSPDDVFEVFFVDGELRSLPGKYLEAFPHPGTEDAGYEDQRIAEHGTRGAV